MQSLEKAVDVNDKWPNSPKGSSSCIASCCTPLSTSVTLAMRDLGSFDFAASKAPSTKLPMAPVTSSAMSFSFAAADFSSFLGSLAGCPFFDHTFQLVHVKIMQVIEKTHWILQAALDPWASWKVPPLDPWTAKKEPPLQTQSLADDSGSSPQGIYPSVRSCQRLATKLRVGQIGVGTAALPSCLPLVTFGGAGTFNMCFRCVAGKALIHP